MSTTNGAVLARIRALSNEVFELLTVRLNMGHIHDSQRSEAQLLHSLRGSVGELNQGIDLQDVRHLRSRLHRTAFESSLPEEVCHELVDLALEAMRRQRITFSDADTDLNSLMGSIRHLTLDDIRSRRSTEGLESVVSDRAFVLREAVRNMQIALGSPTGRMEPLNLDTLREVSRQLVPSLEAYEPAWLVLSGSNVHFEDWTRVQA